MLKFFRTQHLPDRKTGQEPELSPLYEEDLKGLPPTSIHVAECDGLRGDAEAYANRLKASGCDVDLSVYKGQTHNFMIARGALGEGEDPAEKIGEELSFHSSQKRR